MRQKIVRIIKRWPALYNFLVMALSTFQFNRWLELLIGTRAKEKYWAGRSFAESYWENRELPHKRFLADRISAFSPLDSILEVGCASGPNLYLIAKKFPQARIVGIDINREAIEYGNARFAQEGMTNVELLAGKAEEIAKFPDKAFDIVFTNALLIYIGPDKINEVITEIIRVTRKALVLMELHCFEPDKDVHGTGFYFGGNWIRDYAALLGQFIPQGQIKVSRLPREVWPVEPWSKSGAIIEVVR